MLKRYLEAGYKVMVEGFLGDYEITDLEEYEDENLEDLFDFERIEGHTAYFSEVMPEGWDE